MTIKPVAWLDESSSLIYHKTTHPERYTPLYKKRQWVGLTDEERRGIREWQTIQEGLGPIWAPMMLYLYMAIEAKLKERNHG